VTRFDLVVFDLDGTLVDTAPDIAGALAATLAEVGVRPPPLPAVKELVGDGARALIGRALAREGVDRDVDPLFLRFLAHYGAHLADASVPYPGVGEALAELAQAGVAAAVVTNKPGALARELLSRLGIAAGLVCIIGDGDGFPRKPDPAGALSILAAIGSSGARTAVVGDGLPDVRLARALGARAVAATWGYVGADRLRAESPDELASSPVEAVRLLLGTAGPA
jgi:phosphoglycolate phosphatase